MYLDLHLLNAYCSLFLQCAPPAPTMNGYLVLGIFWGRVTPVDSCRSSSKVLDTRFFSTPSPLRMPSSLWLCVALLDHRPIMNSMEDSFSMSQARGSRDVFTYLPRVLKIARWERLIQQWLQGRRDRLYIIKLQSARYEGTIQREYRHPLFCIGSLRTQIGKAKAALRHIEPDQLKWRILHGHHSLPKIRSLKIIDLPIEVLTIVFSFVRDKPAALKLDGCFLSDNRPPRLRP